MVQLNLPAYDHQLRSEGGKLQIFDPIRKKYIHLTPEEWVRQHMIHLLIHLLKYPASRTQIEGGLKYNTRQKRTDILIYDAEMKPQVLVECKAPHVALNQRTLEQLATYNKTLYAKLLITTNGLSTFALWIDSKGNAQMLKEIPSHQVLLEMR